MRFKFLLASIVAALMILPLASPLAAAFQPLSAQNLYNYTANGVGVLSADREDYMNSPYAQYPVAGGGTTPTDIANFIYQGPGIITHTPTVGYMDNMTLWTTQLGTVYFIYNYKNPASEPEGPGYEFEPLPEFPPTINPLAAIPQPQPPENLAGKNGFEPIEGWFLSFDIHPPEIGHFRGVFVATFGGFDTDNKAVVPKVIFNATDGRYFKLTGVDTTVLANTSRLLLVRYDIHLAAESFGDEQNKIDANFTVHIIISFNRATKYVVINQYVDYIIKTQCCAVVPVEVYFGRIAALDANPLSCRSFYGWNNITLPKCSCTTNESRDIFLVLAWANSSLDPDFFDTSKLESDAANNVVLGNKIDVTVSYNRSYAVYMAAYPYNPDLFNYAIVTMKHNNTFAAVWRALYIDGNYVDLNMSDSNNDKNHRPDGDLALVRLQWHHRSTFTLTVAKHSASNMTYKVTVVYGVYDINANNFTGGEAGPCSRSATIIYPDKPGSNVAFSSFTAVSKIVLSNGTALKECRTSYEHEPGSELAFFETNGAAIPAEGLLFKVLSAIDFDGNGRIADGVWPNGERNVPVAWMPVEELAYQLYNIFQGPCFNKLASFKRADFLALPITANPVDPAAVAWVQGVVQAYMITYDIQATEVYVGAAAGGLGAAPDLLPFILLPLQDLTMPVTLAQAAAKFQADDGRVLLQMSPRENATTPYRDRNYLIVSVAGPVPNLVTRYWNDFAGIIYGGQLANVPTAGSVARTFATLDWSVLSKVTTIGSGRLVLTPIGEPLAGGRGLAVIAIAKDHFNNTGVIIYGGSASDSYWAAYWFATNYNSLITTPGLCDKNALLLSIDYGVTQQPDFNLVNPSMTKKPDFSILYTVSGPDLYNGIAKLFPPYP